METSSQNQKLRKYTLTDSVIHAGFATNQDAENYANENGGKVVEVGFKDGNDNPQITNEAGLLENRSHYLVNAGPEYKFIHSVDPAFREYADELQQFKSNEIDKNSPEEKYMSNGEIEIAEDPIIVLKKDQFESVTSRERSKYLKHAKVYEVGVESGLSEQDASNTPNHE
ncbi:hypothetical protein [uncultured Chryseobacterium sp.]|uniref:hypothetical protein n=1 Tax=uncultured Chryseobacterium sp. TaxID=259322 RepID=UPI00261449F8|nr:hypothetical protein [uncultured Chryseobacterium sp.]